MRRNSLSGLFFPPKPEAPSDQELDEVKTPVKKPSQEHHLFVASQGGGGHISAVNALIARYEKETGKEAHPPYLLSKAEVRTELQLQLRELGARLGYYIEIAEAAAAAKKDHILEEEDKDVSPVLSPQQWSDYLPQMDFSIIKEKAKVKIGEFLKWTRFLPQIPELKELRTKSQELLNNLDKIKYLDALLHPHGVVGAMDAVIWNSLQASEKTEQLKDLLSRQEDSDKKKYEDAKAFFYRELCAAREAGNPYTKVVCTQAMTLSALCDAVIKYNKEYKASVYIEQYLTDLATPGAVHFKGALSRLSKEQRQVMNLHAVGPIHELIQHPDICIKKKGDFRLVEELKPEANPMVREGFTKPQLELIDVPNNAFVASIMLGSQAGIATVDYAIQLIEWAAKLQQPCHFYVMAGNKQAEYEAQVKAKFAHLPPNVMLHVLPNQTDKQLGAIKARSNLYIERAGGLCVMESMAVINVTSEMKDSPCCHKAVMVHHSGETAEMGPTSGISWEDGNRDAMRATLEKVDVSVTSTTVKRFKDDLFYSKDIARILFELHKLCQPAPVDLSCSSQSTPSPGKAC